MQTLHSSIKLWPTTGTEGELTFIQMMVAPSAATWLPTYAWIENSAKPLQGMECPTDKATTTKPLLSQDKWDKRKEAAWSMQQACIDNQQGPTSQPQRAAASSNRTTSENPKTYPEPATDKRQWEHMRIFYPSTRLWPVMEWCNSTWIEGGSPLIWTSLHPPGDDG